jgi:myo-inositol 2-dehydrogenase/D-chiro-inositol 1-dehydrogenase
MTLNLALLGAGRIGQVHAQAIHSIADARLLAVSDPVPEAARAITDRFGGTAMTIEAIRDSGDIDAVLICTPTNTHADLIEMFARAGKAMFCEKPVDLSPGRVRACLEVVRQHKAPLMIGFNRRFDPHFKALKASIDRGDIGAVEMITITSRDPGAPSAAYLKTSGGIFKDMSIHDFDMARFLLGEEVVEVIAKASVLVDPVFAECGDYDSASIILTTASGKQCLVSNSRRASYGYDQRIEVHGEKGMVSAKNQRPMDVEIATAAGFTKPPLHDFFMTRYTAAYTAEVQAFIDCVVGHAAPSPSGQDGEKALAIAEAALKSVQTGCTVAI